MAVSVDLVKELMVQFIFVGKNKKLTLLLTCLKKYFLIQKEIKLIMLLSKYTKDLITVLKESISVV